MKKGEWCLFSSPDFGDETDSYIKSRSFDTFADYNYCMVRNRSEAGPDVAECSDEDFRTAAVFEALPSFKLPQDVSKEPKVYSEDEFKQGLKMQEMIFRERQLKKDKEYSEQLKNSDREKQILENEVMTLQKGCRAFRRALEELLTLFHVQISSKEQEHFDTTCENHKLIKEREQAQEDLKNVETAFAALLRRYESCKAVLERYKQNEEYLKQQTTDIHVKIKQQQHMYEMLRVCSQDRLEKANAEIEKEKLSGSAEVTVLTAKLKKAEMTISRLEKDIEQKNRENSELSNICEFLIAKARKV